MEQNARMPDQPIRAADHARWDRELPVRHLLIDRDAELDEELWARCAAAEGLFAALAPPPREVLTLRDCRPAGPLAEALTSPDAALRGLGDLVAEVWGPDRPLQWYDLTDAAVLAHRPARADPGRYDIVLGTGAVGDDLR